jgi:hypothetical protein
MDDICRDREPTAERKLEQRRYRRNGSRLREPRLELADPDHAAQNLGRDRLRPAVIPPARARQPGRRVDPLEHRPRARTGVLEGCKAPFDLLRKIAVQLLLRFEGRDDVPLLEHRQRRVDFRQALGRVPECLGHGRHRPPSFDDAAIPVPFPRKKLVDLALY